jgi:hypothetical protein
LVSLLLIRCLFSLFASLFDQALTIFRSLRIDYALLQQG